MTISIFCFISRLSTWSNKALLSLCVLKINMQQNSLYFLVELLPSKRTILERFCNRPRAQKTLKNVTYINAVRSPFPQRWNVNIGRYVIILIENSACMIIVKC